MDDFFASEGETGFLGIDGGGTKTEFLLKNREGETLRRLVTEGTNPFDVGAEKACQILKNGISEVCRGIPLSCVSVFAGISGGGNPEYNRIFREFLSRQGFAAYGNGSDNANIVEAGLHGKDGIALILGTGICLFRVNGEKTDRLSGNGYLLDDGGSGFNFGRDAIHHYYNVTDGRETAGALFEAVSGKAGCPPDEFLTAIYREGKRMIASYAGCVFETLTTDPASARIFDRNLKEVTELLRTAHRGMSGKTTVVLAGGLTNYRSYTDAIRNALNPEEIEISVLEAAPVEGAVALAMKQWKSGEKEK